MIELLLHMSGPDFLVFFALISIVCIVTCSYWVNEDGTTQYPLPEPTHFDPVSIALLRKGWSSVIKTVIFSLWQRKLVNIEGEGSSMMIVSLSSDLTLTNRLEREIYEFIWEPREPRELFTNYGLHNRLEVILQPYLVELQSQCLARTDVERSRVWTAFSIMAIAIGVLGGMKLLMGIDQGKPVFFLFVLVAISLWALFVVVKPKAIATKLGRHYLKALEDHFAWLKESVRQNDIPEGIDPAYATAIYSIGILEGTSHNSPFSKAFSSSKDSGSGGCGGGCGGGGCGGGGCGGCGGGA